MKVLFTIAIWLAAAALVGWWLLRYRGRVAMIPDQRLPRRMVRIVAVLLVALGVGEAVRAQARLAAPRPAEPAAQAEGRWPRPGDAAYAKQPTHPFDQAAAERLAVARHGPLVRIRELAVILDTGGALDADQRERLNELIDMHDPAKDRWSESMHKLARIVAAQAGVIPERRAPVPPSAETLARLLDGVERHAYDGWLVGYLWRSAPAAGDERSAARLASLLARLETHARMVAAITRARAELGPIVYQPWRSKAAPPPGHQAIRIPDRFVERVRHHFPRLDAGEWHAEATVRLTLATEGKATLIRRGQRLELADGQPLTFRRLDMIEAPPDAPLMLHEKQTGLTLRIPAGQTVGPRDLPRHLDPASARKLEQWVQAARAGQRDAAVKLEWTLPLAHDHVRRALAQIDATDADPPADAGPLPMLLLMYDR